MSDLSEVPPRGRLMALDHGTKRIGVAISDAERRMARPVETIRRTKLLTDIAHLQTLCERHQISAVVIGYPLNMDGTTGPRCQSVRAFVRELEQHIDLPMLLWDERLSSEAATHEMIEAGAAATKRAEKIDATASAIILENLLKQL